MFNAFRVRRFIEKELSSGAKFQRLASPLRSLDSYHLVQFSKSLPDVGEVFGLGKSSDLKAAQIIAYFEYLERKAFLKNHRQYSLLSSSGVAAHKFRYLAAQAAASELKERDSFLVHWYTQTPLLSSMMPKDLNAIKSDLHHLGYDVHIRRTWLGQSETSVAIIVNRKTLGFCLGTSCGKGHHRDVKKAVLEAVINLCYGDYGKSTQDLTRHLTLSRLSSLEDHRALWLYCQPIPRWLLECNDIAPEFQPSVAEIVVIDIETSPFPVVSAKSADLLSLQIGTPSSLASLTRRLPVGYRVNEVLPHPLF